MAGTRENWGSRIGIILAVAGGAAGLGNFLRFPTQVVQNGGGAFMVPYFIAFLFLGIPIAFAEWTLGRFSGQYGRGSAPGVFHVIARKPWAKYAGIFGLFVPLVINFYYLIIESWCLAYAAFSVIGWLGNITNPADMKDFLQEFQGLLPPRQLGTFPWALMFFGITFIANYWIVSRGIVAGIERLNKICMPLLLILAIFLTVRVFMLGTPDPAFPEQNIVNGLGFLWNPNFHALLNVDVWVAAAGQIFFTLSVGVGAILAYSSYLKKNDDIAHSALSSAATNEFVEVILSGSIIIPAAFVFLGAAGAQDVAQSGAFNLGFVTMPLIFNKLPIPGVIGFAWFLLLTLASFTSSVALIQPVLTFIQDELGLTRKKATLIVGGLTLVVSLLVKATLAYGTLDELDFWGGTLFPVLSALVLVIMFAWVFGAKQGLEELNRSSFIRVPKSFVYIIQYVTPLYLLTLIVLWARKNYSMIMMTSIRDSQVWKATLYTRGGLVGLLLILLVAIYFAGRQYGTLDSSSKGEGE